MSASDKPDLVRSWTAGEKVLDEKADRLASSSDEDAARELNKLPDPARVPSAQELVARARERANIGQRRVRRKPPLIAWLVAAALGGLVVVSVIERPDHVASAPPVSRPEGLRRDAIGLCEQASWRLCQEKLDEAQRLDPAGENDPRVQRARKAVFDGLHVDAGFRD